MVVKYFAQYILQHYASTSGTNDEGRYITRSAVPPINTFVDVAFLGRYGNRFDKPLHQVITLEVKSEF